MMDQMRRVWRLHKEDKGLQIISVQETKRQIFCVFRLEKSIRRKKSYREFQIRLCKSSAQIVTYLSPPKQKLVAFPTNQIQPQNYGKNIPGENTGSPAPQSLFQAPRIENTVSSSPSAAHYYAARSSNLRSYYFIPVALM